MKQKDSRIKLISEVLQGIKVLKLYAWENAFIKKVERFRVLELKAVKKYALLLSGALALFVASPFWVSKIERRFLLLLPFYCLYSILTVG